VGNAVRTAGIAGAGAVRTLAGRHTVAGRTVAEGGVAHILAAHHMAAEAAGVRCKLLAVAEGSIGLAEDRAVVRRMVEAAAGRHRAGEMGHRRAAAAERRTAEVAAVVRSPEKEAAGSHGPAASHCTAEEEAAGSTPLVGEGAGHHMAGTRDKTCREKALRAM
jgi:hypothetical protein